MAINSEQIKWLDEQIKKCEEILSNGNPKEAAKQIEKIVGYFAAKGKYFSTSIAYENDKYSYDSKNNLEKLKDLIDELKLYRAELADEYNKTKQDNASQITNNIQVGDKNINAQNSSNANINSKNAKKSLLGRIVACILRFFGIGRS